MDAPAVGRERKRNLLSPPVPSVLRMKRTRAVGGVLLLVLAVVLLAEAFGPYYAGASDLLLSFLVAAIISGIGGVFLLQAARISTNVDRSAMPATVENPHHPAPIRAPMMSTPSGGRAYAVTGGGAGIDNSERKPDEEMPEEPD